MRIILISFEKSLQFNNSKIIIGKLIIPWFFYANIHLTCSVDNFTISNI